MRQHRHLEERQMYLDEQLVYARDANLRLRRPSLDRGVMALRENGALEEDRVVGGAGEGGTKTFLTQPPPTPVNGQARQVRYGMLPTPLTKT